MQVHTMAASEEEEHPESRYAGMEVGGGELVVYDRENHRAWVQSTQYISPEDLQ